MPTVQNQNYVAVGCYIDFSTGNIYVDVAFVDSDDNVPAGSNRYSLPVTGNVIDNKGRVLAASTPANIGTPAGTLKTNILATLATASAAGKVKP
jgi:hypothetical protein